MSRYRWGFDERDAYDKGYEECRWYPQTNPYERYSYNDRKHDAYRDACRDRSDERRRHEEEEERERQEEQREYERRRAEAAHIPERRVQSSHPLPWA